MDSAFVITDEMSSAENNVRIGKYQANIDSIAEKDITFFVASPDIDLADLQHYREQTKADRLIAINTTDTIYDCLKLADSIVYCSSDETELAIYGLARMADSWGFIGVDFNDMLWLTDNRKHIQFIKAYAKGKSYIANACQQLNSEIKKLNSDCVLECALITILTDSSFNFDEQEVIKNNVEKSLKIDNGHFFYQVLFHEESEYWQYGEQGCCICAYLVFSDDEKDLKNKSL